MSDGLQKAMERLTFGQHLRLIEADDWSLTGRWIGTQGEWWGIGAFSSSGQPYGLIFGKIDAILEVAFDAPEIEEVISDTQPLPAFEEGWKSLFQPRVVTLVSEIQERVRPAVIHAIEDGCIRWTEYSFMGQRIGGRWTDLDEIERIQCGPDEQIIEDLARQRGDL